MEHNSFGSTTQELKNPPTPLSDKGGSIQPGMEVEVINLNNCKNLFGTVKVGDKGMVDHIWHTGGQDVCVVFGDFMAFMNEDNLTTMSN